ncbi:unannotated protein [freshwater metagenome]|uniref:Unannotated protein n=1 Tax=freshwater metagenome TaxID=449393 RepID=A0A6J6YLX8_9ZZZZ
MSINKNIVPKTSGRTISDFQFLAGTGVSKSSSSESGSKMLSIGVGVGKNLSLIVSKLRFTLNRNCFHLGGIKFATTREESNLWLRRALRALRSKPG